jgi:hypothetical protein
MVEAAREAAEATVPRSGGDLADTTEPACAAMHWNTVYDLGGRGVCTPSSREWCRDWGGVVMFGWDTSLNGIVAALDCPERAWDNFRASLSRATPEGFVPNWAISGGATTWDRSQPPVGAYCALWVHRRHPSPEHLAEIYPGLLKWHDWWPKARDGNGDGLLAWGSTPGADYEFPELKQAMHGEQICACYESGLDNSPLYDSVPLDPESGTLIQADVGLNSLFAVDAEALAEIATTLGKTEDASRLRAEHRDMCARIEKRLWCEERGLFLNRSRTGEFSPRLTPTTLYPLLAGIPSGARATRLLDACMDPDTGLDAPAGLASIAVSDVAYGDNDYWRGRVWPPMNFLAAEGMARKGHHARACAGAAPRRCAKRHRPEAGCMRTTTRSRARAATCRTRTRSTCGAVSSR